MEKNKKRILVKFDHQCGEFEFGASTVLSVPTNKEPTYVINDYFMNYYGEGLEAEYNEKSGIYTYGIGEVAVKKINFMELTNQQSEVLKELGL